MKKHNLLYILLSILLVSCGDDCNDCFTPPQSFIFEIVDKNTGENLFTNNTFQPNQINIRDIATNAAAEYSFISENDMNLIQISNIGFKTEIVSLKIDIANSHIFDFYVDVERRKDDCCSFTQYKEIQISDAEFQQDPESGFYKILVDL